ncbi:MAG: hypothetical protein CMJ81_11290 [Planctomycetaceae bacterium]|jgi:hypothetical protein|nr:hypothetical protein [Planctomycetaceae bacterium]MBP63634.1 hypothetical protein [Planctomycetaceae bacterium]
MVNCGFSLVLSGWLIAANVGFVSESLLLNPHPGFSEAATATAFSRERLLLPFAQLDVESGQPLIQRLDSETRGDLMMKLLLILMAGFVLMLFTWMAARIVRRIGKVSYHHGRLLHRTTQPGDDWWKKSMISSEDRHLPE